MKIYRTISGDQWDLISFKVYNSEYYVDKLVEANISHIRTIYFDAGISLTIPDVVKPIPINTNSWSDIVKFA
jgi:phage tail protein X